MSNNKHLDEKWLRDRYFNKEMSGPEIADACDVSAQTVYDAMDRFGIDRDATRYGYKSKVPYATYYVDDKGYPRWQAKGRVDGDRKTWSYHVHRLTAIAEYGIDAVKGKEVHHKNEIPFDNRPENLEPLTVKEHNEPHLSLDKPERMAAAALWEASDMSSDDVGDMFGVSGSTVRRYRQRELSN